MSEEELPPILQDFAIVLRAAGVKPTNELLDDLGGVVDHYEQSRDQQIALAAKIQAAEYIDGKLMADEPEVIASNKGEDHDNVWFKAQLTFSDYISEEIGSYIGELEATLKQNQGEK